MNLKYVIYLYIQQLLTDLVASIFNINGVLGTANGDSHCSNSSSKNCKHDLISNSSSFRYESLGWADTGDFSFTFIINESLSSLSVSSWTSDVTSRVRIADADI